MKKFHEKIPDFCRDPEKGSVFVYIAQFLGVGNPELCKGVILTNPKECARIKVSGESSARLDT